MEPTRPFPSASRPQTSPTDLQLAQSIASGDVRAFEGLMRRHNRLVFRTVRGVIRSDAEAEDVTQDAWLAAYRHIAQLDARASFSTWLTRTAVRIALQRMREHAPLHALDEVGPLAMDTMTPLDHADLALERGQLVALIERALDTLPLEYRMVLVLREVEQRSTTETAEILGTTQENVIVRLHRARAALRTLIKEELGDAMHDVFAFDDARSDWMTAGVLARLARAS